MRTPGPWILNGQVRIGQVNNAYRIDAPLEGRVGLDFLKTPVALVAGLEDARLIAEATELLRLLEKSAGATHEEHCAGGDWRTCNSWTHREENAAIGRAKGET